MVCNSPPFTLPSRECGYADDYFDKTVEQLAEEMGKKVLKKMLIISYADNNFTPFVVHILWLNVQIKKNHVSGGSMAELESAGLVIWRPSVPVPPSRLAGFVLGSQEYKSSAMLVK